MDNHNHPELKPGEFYLSNTTPAGFENIDWETKRMGKHAYVNGEPYEGLFPVFVKKSEKEGREVESRAKI